MRTGSLCRCDNRLRIGARIKASNVASDCSVKEFDVLWQISDMLAKRFRRPLIELCMIEADTTARWLPNANERARERRFSRTAWPNNP